MKPSSESGTSTDRLAPSLSDSRSPAFGQGSTRWCNWQARPALVREATGSSPVRVARHPALGGKAEVPMLFDNRMRPSGEIGRRAGFRIQYPPGCPSSSLGAGTGQLAVRVRCVGAITRCSSRWRRADQHSRRVRLPFPGIDRLGIFGQTRVLADEVLMAERLASNQETAGSIPVIRSQS